MTVAFASSKKAIAECDICGFRFKLRELRNIITRGRDTNIKACPECFSPDHPQNKQGLYPVRDPQAIRDPRAHAGTNKSVRTGVQLQKGTAVS